MTVDAKVPKLTLAEQRVVALLKECPRGMSCAEIGEALWGKSARNRQSYCRPAGKLMASLLRKRCVYREWDSFRKASVWKGSVKP